MLSATHVTLNESDESDDVVTALHERIMHSPSARALSRPRPLLHALNPVMHTQLVSKYYLMPNMYICIIM